MAAHAETDRANALYDESRYREALDRYLEMARNGDDRAMVRVGWMFQHGLGTVVDPEQARTWYEAAANSGSLDGLYYLGWLHWTRREFELAHALWTRASEGGHLGALYRLGATYDFGEGVPHDEAKARSYYERAAARGHVLAQRAIAGRMVRGDYGASRILAGLWLVGKTVWQGIRTMRRDEFSKHLR